MPTINNQLRDFLLKRSHYVYSFENGTIQSIIEPYQNAKAEIMTKIADLEDYGRGWTLQYRMDRLNVRLNEIDMVLKNATQDSITNLSDNLNSFAMSEKEYIETLLSNPFGQIGIDIVRLPFEQVYGIVNTPIGGEMYHERMVQRYGESMRVMKANLTQSVIQGEDMAKAGRRLMGIGKDIGGVVGNKISAQSAVIARTEIMRVSNAVSEKVYDENKDVLKGTEWIATLDNRTCPVCGNLDGKVFYFNKEAKPPMRPLHPLCRCTLVPVTKSWKELGADQKIQEPDAGTRPFVYTGEKPPPGSRQYLAQKAKWAGDVPEKMAYPDWLKMMDAQDPDFVRGILGSKRYNLWRTGQIEFKEMVKNNKVISIRRLDELAGEKSLGIRIAEEPSEAVIRAIKSDTAAGGPDAARFKAMTKIDDFSELEEWVNSGIYENEEGIYRVLSFTDKEWKNLSNEYQLGGIFKSKRAIRQSFSKSAERAPLKGGDVFVKVKVEGPVIGRDISRWSIYSEEQEVLVSGKVSFKVVKRELKSPGSYEITVEQISPPKGLGAKLAETFSHPEWTKVDLINAITMGDFVLMVKKGRWEEVAKHLDEVLAKRPLAVVQHNMNELNLMRYFPDMPKEKWKAVANEYANVSRSKLYKNALPVQSLPAEMEAKMSARQIAASKNVWKIDTQTRSIADDVEKKIAAAIKGEHNIANTPFDVFLDNEFIEVKTQLRNYAKGYKYQIQVHAESKPAKAAFEKRYGVRGHLVAVDMTPGSETFGKVFYSPEIKKHLLGSMDELGFIDDKDIGAKIVAKIKKGAKAVKPPEYARATTPTIDSLKKAEDWAKKNIGVKKIDFDDLKPEAADLFNQYVKGAVDELGVKMKGIRFDSSFFTGRNTNLAGLSFEDGTVAFNPQYFKTIKDLKQLSVQQARIGQFLTDSKGHIFRHEIAHQRYFKLGGTEVTAAKRVNVGELKKAIGKTDLPKYVSKYALQSEGEFYAEMIARRLDGQKLHPVCEKFVKDIERKLGASGVKIGRERGIPIRLKKEIEIGRTKKDILSDLVKTKKEKGAVDFSSKNFSHYRWDNVDKNVASYVGKDKPPTGLIGKSLDALVKKSKPSKIDVISYRGMVVPERFVKDIREQLSRGINNVASLKLKTPSSWTNSSSVAWDFAKKGGYRAIKGAKIESVVIEVRIPKGTKLAQLNLAFGVGNEHILASNTFIDIIEVKQFRTGWKIIGEIRS